MVACGEGGDLLPVARVIVSKQVGVAVVGLEPALRGSVPAVDDGAEFVARYCQRISAFE
jgi:hypothetical protein